MNRVRNNSTELRYQDLVERMAKMRSRDSLRLEGGDQEVEKVEGTVKSVVASFFFLWLLAV
jgi:hypothetical protein